MDKLNIDSRQSIYFELGYVIAGHWQPDILKRLDFQKALAAGQLDFPRTSVGPREFTLVRAEPSQFTVKISSMGPRVSGISISSERPEHTLDMFIREAEVVCSSYSQVWLDSQFQVLQTNARIRHLYSCSDHSFKFLWEDRLRQSPQDFEYLGGRNVLGGGLRLVMPPLKTEAEPVQIEVKIESFFAEPKKMFVETIFAWPNPRLVSDGEEFDVQRRLEDVERYATGEVCDFILLRQKGGSVQE